jgi:hypothetical protein
VGLSHEIKRESIYFVHKIDEVNVKWVLAKVFANHLEDPALQDKRVVYSRKSDSLYTVPAGLAAASDARAHDIIRNEIISLELDWAISVSDRTVALREKKTDPFDEPAENGSLEVFRLCKLVTLEDSDRVDDAQTPVEFSAWDVVVHDLSG